MGFTAKGETVNYSTTNISSWQEVCESSAKVVTLLDTCGHPRFLKTTISGLTGHSPDYACLVVDSRVGGVSEMTREHLALAVALGLPTFVVVTKMDVATREQLRATATALMALIRSTGPSCLPSVDIEAGFSSTTMPSSTSKTSATGTLEGAIQKFVPVIVHKENDLEAVVGRFSNVQIIDRTNSVAIPILLLSSVTGENVNLLEKMLRLLPKPSLDDHGGTYSQEPACYQIEEIYNIPGVFLIAVLTCSHCGLKLRYEMLGTKSRIVYLTQTLVLSLAVFYTLEEFRFTKMVLSQRTAQRTSYRDRHDFLPTKICDSILDQWTGMAASYLL